MRLTALLMLLTVTVASLAQESGSSHGLRIGPGDLISVEVFDVPELKQELRVSDAGDAELALIGKLHLAGMTVEDAEQAIAVQLAARQLVLQPQVSLFIREYATQGASVSGEVQKPGVYPVLGPRTLLQIVSEAGGLTQIASPKIVITHLNGEQEQVAVRTAAAVAVQPGDSVFVPRAGIVYIVGDVTRSGGYVMHDEGELSIAQLVALGGGLQPTAKANKARLIRKTAVGPQEISVNVKDILKGKVADLQLQADDILFIPNSALKSAGMRLQNITQMTAGAAIYSSLN